MSANTKDCSTTALDIDILIMQSGGMKTPSGLSMLEIK